MAQTRSVWVAAGDRRSLASWHVVACVTGHSNASCGFATQTPRTASGPSGDVAGPEGRKIVARPVRAESRWTPLLFSVRPTGPTHVVGQRSALSRRRILSALPGLRRNVLGGDATGPSRTRSI